MSQKTTENFTQREIELQKSIRWQPHEAQVDILKNMKRFTVICAGTRFGKSQLCAYLALKKLLNRGTHTWIVSPTYDLSKKVFEHLNTFLGNGFPEDLSRNRIKISRVAGKLAVRFPRLNSWVECKSAEFPTGLLGEELDLVIMDECSRMKTEVYDSYISQRLTSRKGSAMFISTPFGQNWFYRQHIYCKDSEDGASFHFRSKDNPYFPESEWEREKKRLPQDVFRQEYEAVFLRDAAGVFRKVREAVSGEQEAPQKGHYYMMGVDLGKRQDFTVISVIDRSSHHLVHFDRFKQVDWNLQKQRIFETAKKYNHARIVIDSTGLGDPITDDLRRMGLAVDDFRYTNKSKSQLVDKLTIWIEQGRLTYPDIEVLIDELEAFGYTKTDSGNIKYSAPEGLHDDCVNSLALAVWQLPENPVKEDVEPIIFKHTKY